MKRRVYVVPAAQFEVKAANGGGGDWSISGYASITGFPHITSAWELGREWKDVFAPEAFKRSLQEHAANGTLPAMLQDHSPFSVLGGWSKVAEDATGLRVEGKIALDLTLA